MGRNFNRRHIFSGAVVITMGVLCLSNTEPLRLAVESVVGFNGSPRLISVQEVPDTAEMCERPEAYYRNAVADNTNLFTAFDEQTAYADSTSDVTRPPVRKIQDNDPIYSSVAVDTRFNEVYLQDANTWTIRVFNRQDNTPPDAARTAEKRLIGGQKTDVQFNSCVYVDPNGDIYSAENDIGDSVVMFSHEDQVKGYRDADGNIPPTRKLKVTHRAYGIAVDEQRHELYLTIQYPPQMAVYRKEASGNEKPLRVLQGDQTRLSDVHGIGLDTAKQLLFINTWGNISDYKTAGTGRFESASIAVYSQDASGNTAPLRIIQGPKTQLDWPGAMSVNPATGELYVANDMGQSILVFHETDQGDVAPVRVIKGPKTGLSYPTGVFVDTKNNELWASNLGNSSATCYPLNANGNVAPVRTIRSAPQGKVSLRFGKTQALAYDSNREEVLVPN